MPITTSPVQRIFVINSVEREDPDPDASIDEIQERFAAQFPHLTNASHETEMKDGRRVVTFKQSIGKKG